MADIFKALWGTADDVDSPNAQQKIPCKHCNDGSSHVESQCPTIRARLQAAMEKDRIAGQERVRERYSPRSGENSSQRYTPRAALDSPLSRPSPRTGSPFGVDDESPKEHFEERRVYGAAMTQRGMFNEPDNRVMQDWAQENDHHEYKTSKPAFTGSSPQRKDGPIMADVYHPTRSTGRNQHGHGHTHQHGHGHMHGSQARCQGHHHFHEYDSNVVGDCHADHWCEEHEWHKDHDWCVRVTEDTYSWNWFRALFTLRE